MEDETATWPFWDPYATEQAEERVILQTGVTDHNYQ